MRKIQAKVVPEAAKMVLLDRVSKNRQTIDALRVTAKLLWVEPFFDNKK